MKLLILTRRIGEKIMIGDDTAITVLDVKGNMVLVGACPPDQDPLVDSFVLRIGRSVMIDEDVSIKLLSRSGNQVSIGITAPDDVPVHRLEVYNRVKHEEEGEL